MMMKNISLAVCAVTLAGAVSAQQQGIINNADSKNVKLKSVNIGDCQWTDGFWGDKFKLCEEVMVPHMGELLKSDVGFAFDNFKIAAGLKEGKHQGMKWHDGDFYKWMEAAMYVYAVNKDPAILKDIDECIKVIGMAQCDDGYLSTQTQLVSAKKGIQEKRWSNRQLHEMYNSGHLLTSACIHKRITGQDNFFKIAEKHADFLVKTFMPCPDHLKRFGFNQTQIMGLAEMYRETGKKEYLQLAEQFINRRGKSGMSPESYASYKFIGDMVQERTPLRNAKEAAGHAVLALYYYAGAADVYAETGEKALIDALDRMWDSVVNHKMYITGACGQTHHGVSPKVDMVHEAFIADYMMPNASAYNETCANICNGMFSYRMLGIHGESKYGDIVELVLYNTLSGISQEGTHYFYTNPLRRTFDKKMGITDYKDRAPYIPCFCCPPNLLRTIAKSSNWAYSLADNGVAVNLYGGNTLSTKMLDGSAIKLKQESNYPWDGAVKITMQDCKADAFDLMLRVPGWAEGTKIMVNGKDTDLDVTAGKFATLNRAWKAGDVVELDIPMEAKLMSGNPLIEETRNQAAIKRGPVVYCMETPDLPEGTSILDVYLPSDIKLKPSTDAKLTDGCTTLSGKVLLRDDQKTEMYAPLAKPKWEKLKTQFVPYYAWSNRGTAEMTVWLPVVWE